MADLLRKSSAWLEGQRHTRLTARVTYVRGDASVALKATVGKTVFELQVDYGAVEKTESRDFLVRAKDLVLDGTRTLPERGDQVRETAGGKIFVYEVMAPGKEPHWRYSDLYRRTLRIHTKHVGTEDA